MEIKLSSIKWALQEYWKEQNISRSIMEITDVTLNILDTKNINVEITLVRPGLLIGKGGRDINGLTAWMNTVFSSHVKIVIIESHLWRS